jgi:hypothetical protein
MRSSFHIPLMVLVLGLAPGCGGRHPPTQPVDRAPEACCTDADEQLQQFAGCRVGGRCRQSEVFWMRGAVTCGPVDEASCANGRCCHYRPRYNPDLGAPADADETPEPPGELASEDEPATDIEPAQATDIEPAQATDIEPAPAAEGDEATDPAA